jgi:hypothetical protein
MIVVTPAAIPLCKARWPADRPITTTKYHRFVVRESSMRFRNSSKMSCRAVSKPKVGMSPGKGRSLSIVLGT